MSLIMSWPTVAPGYFLPFFLAPTGAQERLMYVRSFAPSLYVRSFVPSLSEALNLHHFFIMTSHWGPEQRYM